MRATDSAASRPLYRCYFVDDRRRVVTVEVLDRVDDDAAIRASLALLDQRNRPRWRYAGLELWDRARLVHRHPGRERADPVTARAVPSQPLSDPI